MNDERPFSNVLFDRYFPKTEISKISKIVCTHFLIKIDIYFKIDEIKV